MAVWKDFQGWVGSSKILLLPSGKNIYSISGAVVFSCCHPALIWLSFLNNVSDSDARKKSDKIWEKNSTKTSRTCQANGPYTSLIILYLVYWLISITFKFHSSHILNILGLAETQIWTLFICLEEGKVKWRESCRYWERKCKRNWFLSMRRKEKMSR